MTGQYIIDDKEACRAPTYVIPFPMKRSYGDIRYSLDICCFCLSSIDHPSFSNSILVFIEE